MEDYNVRKRLELKFHKNEIEMLSNEREAEYTVSINAEKKKHKAPAHYLRKVKDKSIQIATCFHYFLGEDPTDLSCENCICH